MVQSYNIIDYIPWIMHYFSVANFFKFIGEGGILDKTMVYDYISGGN